ncbi:MAG TPA: glycosyltransferase [Opitutaceae bacterium]
MSAPARILIVTSGPLARNPRVVKEASTLGAAGYDVTVLTPRNHAASEPFDAALCAAAPFCRLPVDLIPGFGLSAWRAFWRLMRHRLARVAMRRFRVPSLHALGPANVILRAARAQRADLTIVHNEVPHGIGLRLLAEGRRVAADIEDWHSEDLLPDDRLGRPLELLRRQERALLQEAAYTSTTSEVLSAALHSQYGGRPPQVITNSFPLQPAPPPRTSARPLEYVWFSQTIGPGRGLETFFAAWKQAAGNARVTLIGEVAASYRQALLAPLEPAQQARIKFTGYISPTELPARLARADVGLALERREPRSRGLTITNKILQYFNAGLAVLATDTAGQCEAMREAGQPGLLVSSNDTAGFAAALTRLENDRPLVAGGQHAARAAAERRYCWEREAPRLLALVAEALGPARRS